MKRNTIEKIAVTLVLVLWYFLMPQTACLPANEDLSHYTYLLCHANIWHLAGNLFVLWLMKGNLHLPSSLLIAVFCSFLPAVGSIFDGFLLGDGTMGFSGVLFAMAGVKWGKYIWRQTDKQLQHAATKKFMIQVLPFALVGVVIPHISWCIHLYCLLMGFVYGRCRR